MNSPATVPVSSAWSRSAWATRRNASPNQSKASVEPNVITTRARPNRPYDAGSSRRVSKAVVAMPITPGSSLPAT